MTKPLILVIGNNHSDLEQMTQQLEEEGYSPLGASSPEEIGTVIKEHDDIKLAVLDLTGFDKNIWDCCDRLNEAKIPYIVLAPQRSPAVQRDSMKHGANGLLVKPVGIKEIIEHINAALGN